MRHDSKIKSISKQIGVGVPTYGVQWAPGGPVISNGRTYVSPEQFLQAHDNGEILAVGFVKPTVLSVDNKSPYGE